MANVSFKRGLASALTASGFTAQDGVFYLTTDSHRLYVGQNTELIELNRYVKVVATTDDLPSTPAKDDFAFVTTGNMLLVCKDPSAEGVKKWTQINSQTVDTNTDTTIAVKGTPSVVADDTGVTVSFTFSQTETNKKNNNTTAKADIPVSFKINSSDIATANSIAVAIGSKAVTGGSTIAVSGAGSTASSVTLKQGSNVTISDDGKNNITISATDTKYSFGAAANKLNLTTGSTNSGSVNVSGDDYVTLTADAANGVKAAHKTYDDLAATKGDAITGIHGGKFTIVSSMERDAGGHLTGYTTQEVTLPADNNTTNKSAAVSADNAGNLAFTVTDSQNNTVTGKAEKALYFTVNDVPVYNQGTISFYTKTEIDEKVNGINAMVYRGTVGGEGSTVKQLPASNVAIGDTYMAAAVGTFGGHSCKNGDLLIATGTETDGIITSGLTWTYVPSGDNTDTHYTISNNGGSTITLKPNVGTDTTSVTLTAGTNIDVTGSAGKITIGHADVNHNTSTGTAVSGYGKSFKAITDITVNDQGHVTDIQTTDITMPFEQDVSSRLTIGNNHGISLKGPGTAESAINLVAGNDTITMTDDAANGTITIGHKAYTVPLEATPSESGQTIDASDRTFTVVTGVKRDATGHLSEIDTTKFTLPVDNNTTYSFSGKAAAENNVATITNALTEKGSNTSAGTSITKIDSGSLKISATNNTITMDLEWGTF